MDSLYGRARQVTITPDQKILENRTRELTPLADALTIMVRGITDVRVENTGGGTYNVVGTLGGWELSADEHDWALTDGEGFTRAIGVWFEDEHYLTLDPDTGTLDPDECEAAAATFAAAYFRMIGVNPNNNR